MSEQGRSNKVVLVRHAETEWSLSGRHTSITDLPLTEGGRSKAKAISALLNSHTFDVVLTSPMKRSLETCQIAGLREAAQIRDGLVEWNYGDYEGLTTDKIREDRPDWLLWTDGAPGGETPAQVRARVDEIVEEVCSSRGDVAIFSHGHLLRALAARWITLPVADGRLFRLGTGSLSILGWEREIRVIDEWNRAPGPASRRDE